MQHKIVNMLDPQSHHNPQPKRSSSSGTLNMIPPWNIHTVKQSMPRSCSNGCYVNWFTPSAIFQLFQWPFLELAHSLRNLSILPTCKLAGLNSPNLPTGWSHYRTPMMYIKSSIWSGFEIKNWIEDQFQSSPKLVGIWTVLRCIFVPNLEIVTSIGGELCMAWRSSKWGKFWLWSSI